MYAQCVNSVYTVYNSKNCFPKSTNAGKKKRSRKRELKNADVEPKRTLRSEAFFLSLTREKSPMYFDPKEKNKRVFLIHLEH